MAVTISAGLVVTFFTRMRIFFEMDPDEAPRPRRNMFMGKGIATFGGHCSGTDAIVQMLLVPVLITLGLLQWASPRGLPSGRQPIPNGRFAA